MALWACHLVEKQVEKQSLELARFKTEIESTRERFVDMQRTYVKEVRSGK
jgi:hypothetical protein